MSASLYKASSKPERVGETGSQRQQTVGNKGSKSKAHQEHNHNHNHSHSHIDDCNYHHMTLLADSTSLHDTVSVAPPKLSYRVYPHPSSEAHGGKPKTKQSNRQTGKNYTSRSRASRLAEVSSHKKRTAIGPQKQVLPIEAAVKSHSFATLSLSVL